jgi:FG-GAP repeat
LSGLAKGQNLSIALTDHSDHQIQTTMLSANRRFSLGQMRYGMEYAPFLIAQPEGQICTITTTDDVVRADENSIDIRCSTRQFALTGAVVGVKSDLTLINKTTGEQVFLSAGANAFSFSQLASAGQAYEIQVLGTPEGSTCKVLNGTGLAGSNLSNLQVLCDPIPIPVPEQPQGLQVDIAIKHYAFSWIPSATASYYEFAQDADGDGPQLENIVGSNFQTNRYSYSIDTLLPSRLNALYRVRACNAGGCSAYSAAITPDISKAIGYLKASNSRANLNFGFFSMAISADGNTLAVGASSESSNANGVDADQTNQAAPGAGAVYLYKRSNGTWTQKSYLKASNTRANAGFGVQVALSADASTLAIGAWRESSNATGIDDNQSDPTAPNSGAVYVFTHDSITWNQQAYIKPSNTKPELRFGQRIALSANGNTMAVGSSRESSNATGMNGDQNNVSSSEAGAVYVFTRAQAVWRQEAYLKASNTNVSNIGTGDRFGIAIAISADGNTLAVGAQEEDGGNAGISTAQSSATTLTNSGAVYLYSRQQNNWGQKAYLKSGAPRANAYFGWGLAMSADGNTLAIGAGGESSNATGIAGNQNDASAVNAGAVYIY